MKTSLDWRARKQIVIALIFFVILGGISWSGWQLVKPEPSCFDRKQNQGEEGIDCGGPCPSCELKTLRPIEVLQTSLFLVPPRSSVGVARIRNPNLRWAVAEFGGRWELFDEGDRVVSTSSASFWLRAGETKDVVAVLSLPEASPRLEARLTLEGEARWVIGEDTPDISLLVRSHELLRTRDGAKVEGVLRNDSRFDLDRVSVTAILFDRGGKLTAAGKSELRTLRSGEERFFLVSLPMVTKDIVLGEIRVFGDTNLFDPQNFLRK